MAESASQPPIPTPCIKADLCILTPRNMLRTVTYWTADTYPENETQLTVIADAIKTAFTPAIPNVIPNTCYFQRVEARYYGNGSAGFFANSTAAAGVGLVSVPQNKDEDGGSESEDVMPYSSAVIIQKKTGLVGRANQGRVFVGAIAESMQYAGEIAYNKEAYFTTLASKFNTDITVNGGGFTTVLHGRHWRRSPNALIPITKVYVIKGLTDLKRRQPKLLKERL